MSWPLFVETDIKQGAKRAFVTPGNWD